jgi:hypothetical protein
MSFNMIIIIMGVATILLGLVAYAGWYLKRNYNEIKAITKGNCLIWRHPKHNPNRVPKLELIDFPDAPGADWFYDAFWFLPTKRVKWVYEKETANKNIVYEAFEPDDFIDKNSTPAIQLFDELDWTPAQRLLRQKAPLLQKLAQGGTVIMGVACIFGIMFLLDMLQKGGT